MPFPPASPAERLMPALFVIIWATGFVVARLIAPHAEPFTFLFIRYCLTIAVLGGLCLAIGAPWPRTARGWRDGLVAGVLLHGVYLGGVFWSVSHGLPAGIAALIAGMQPLLTGALAGPLIGERVSPRRWLGIVTGFAGALLVLVPKFGGVDGLAPMAVLACTLGMVSITMGTFWQKRTGAGSDLRTNAVVQFVGAALVTLPAMLLAGDMRFVPAPAALAGLAWAVIILSMGGILLLMHLIRRGAVAGVASLLYLVPPVSAVMAYLLFGESLAPAQMLGMAVAAIGVAIASRGA